MIFLQEQVQREPSLVPFWALAVFSVVTFIGLVLVAFDVPHKLACFVYWLRWHMKRIRQEAKDYRRMNEYR